VATTKEGFMAGEALFIGWGAVVRGREKQALQVFQESMGYYGRLQQEGRGLRALMSCSSDRTVVT
jgi:hypothetical protein